jgi:hypothetical protein
MANAINWFELPANNFARAKEFYGKVLDAELQEMEMNGSQMAFFPSDQQGVGGCIIAGNGSTPQADGSLIYLNGGDDLNTPLSRVEAAGGKVIMPKTNIGENGNIAMFMDSEGNRVAFHSMG